jgi:predicted aldo/keto reductase-like oxidoreductase
MRFKQYGNTGKNVSSVGFGGMRFDMSRSVEENAELVRYACSRGINYFDTAPGYCDDKSELIFGEAFKAMPGQFYVSTKAMPTSFDTAQKAKDQVRKSLERLGVPRIDFYHIWCLRKMEHYELAMRPGGQYDGLCELQAEGLIDHIVCSSHMPGREIRQIVDDGKVEGVLLGMNILNFPYRWDGVKAAYAGGRGIVAMNPLGGGAIPTHEKELAWLSTDGETPTEAALRFLLACPEVSVTLVGFTTREQVDQACAIADAAASFTEADLDRIRQRIGENMNTACSGCGYCIECPQNLPIPSYMQYFNEKQVFGKSDEEMIKQLDFQHNWGLLANRKADAADCIECGLCEEACTQHLPIIERLKEIAAWEAGK